jgi:hypothetical protein
MKSLLPALLMLCSFAHAQVIPNFSEPELQPCYGGDEVMTMPSWSIYQTLDNLWDGTRDSTVCVNAGYDSFKLDFNSAEVDASRPVFLKADVDTTMNFGPHELWKFSTYFYSSSILVDNVDYCNDGYCSGILMEVEVPESDSSVVIREYFANYNGSMNQNQVEMCVPFEHMEFSRVKTFVIKLIVAENALVELLSPFQEDMGWGTLYMDSLSMTDYYNGSNTYEFYAFNSGIANFVLPFDALDGFPSVSNISYLDLYPIQNSVDPQEITLNFTEYSSLIFEPFTAFRGGLVEGSDSVRHTFALINDGMEICMYPEFEVVMQPLTSYEHRRGSINFGHKACIRFKYNSDLIVAENAHFVCGTAGEGLLATDDGSRITVEENATFEINNGIALFDSPWLHEEQWTEVDVYKGGKIIFKEGSYVSSHVDNKRYKWLIHLHGGSADLSGLSPEDREYFVVVGKDAEVDSHELVILGNPAKNVVHFEFNTYELGEWQLEVLDDRGKLHLRESLVLETSKNNRSLDVEKLPAGMYFLSLTKDDQKVQSRILIAE